MPNTFFNAFADLDQVKDLIKDEVGNKHTYNNELYEKTIDGFKKTSIQRPEHYISESSLDATTESIFILKQVELFVSKAPCLRDYQVQMLLPGQSGTYRMHKDCIFALWGSEKNPTFFDAQMMTSSGVLNCWNRKSGVSGLEHSGDIVQTHNGKSYFIHHNVFHDSKVPSLVYAIAAVGYTNKPLYLWQSACPCIMIVDHDTQSLNVVPFSLERATIRNATLIAPIVFKISGTNMSWHVLSEPLTDNNVDTGIFSNAFQTKMNNARVMFDRWFQSGILQRDAVSSSTIRASSSEPISSNMQSNMPQSHDMIEMVQDGLTIELQEDSFQISFGVSLEKYRPSSAPSVLLPICSGFAVGHPALALGQRSSLSSSLLDYKNMLNCAKCIMIHVSDGWRDSLMQAVVDKINGIMIFHMKNNLSMDKTTRVSEMNDVSIPCARFMGSMSLIFLKTLNGITYLYRGSSKMWSGLIPEECDVGDEVDYSHITQWCRMSSTKCLYKGLVDNIVDVNYKRFIYCGMVYDTFPYLSLKEDYDILEVKFLFSQARVVLSSVEANQLRETLSSRFMKELKIMKETHNANLQTIINEMKHCDPSFMNHYTDKISEIKRTMKNIDKEHILMFDLVDSFSSERLTSKRNVSIQQIQRKESIKTNVKSAESMTTDQFGDMLMKSTDCCIVSELELHDHFYEMLVSVSNSDMQNYLTKCSSCFAAQIQNKQNFPLLCASKTCLTLESEIIPSLVQHKGQEHYLTSDGVQLTFVLQGKSCIVLPIFSHADFVKGKYVNWMEEANSPDVATWRICFRKSLRLLHLRIPIDKTSQDLNAAIQLIILSTAWSLSLTMNKVDVQFSNTTSELMRGLLYLWGTTCAAGEKPFSFAFTILNQAGKVEVPKSMGEYFLYAMAAYLYPYTGINSNFIVNNTRLFIIKVLRKRFVQAETESMRKSLDELKAKDQKKIEIERNVALQWNQASSAVLTKFFNSDISEEKAKIAADFLLNLKPEKGTYTTEKLEQSLSILKSKGQDGLSETIVKKIIADSAAKRGAIMLSAKKNVMSIKNPANKTSSTATSILTKRKEVLYKHLGVRDFKVQNWNAYAEYDIAKIRGDAEFKRTPYKIESSHSIPSSKTYSSLMHEALDLSCESNSSNQLSESEGNTLISRLSKIPKSYDAVSIAQKLHTICFDDVFGPSSCLLLDAAKINNDNKNIVVQSVVSCLLDNWRDLTEGEKLCLSLLNDI